MVVNTSLHQTEYSDGSIAGPAGGAFIHRLPAEVVKTILLIIINPEDWVNCIKLGAVCWRWREIVNSTKHLWNHIDVSTKKSGTTYPCQELFRIILERARGSSIRLYTETGIGNFKWILMELQSVQLDISELNFTLNDDKQDVTELDRVISHLYLPSLEDLTLGDLEKSDSQKSYVFWKYLFNMAVRSKVVNRLRLCVVGYPDTLLSDLITHEVFLKAMDLQFYIERGAGSSLQSIDQPIYLPTLRKLSVHQEATNLLKCLVAPSLHSFTSWYNMNSHLMILKSVASQLRTLSLSMNAKQPILEACPAPFLNLNALTIHHIPPPSSCPVILAPNITFLHLSNAWNREGPEQSHDLGYMLGPEGMLGPIHALKRLDLSSISLSNGDQEDYCTYYLEFHPCLEYLGLTNCEIPGDFLERMLKPLGGTGDLLPNLKKLKLTACGESDPSDDWFVELTRLRPSLEVTCQHICRLRWPKREPGRIA